MRNPSNETDGVKQPVAPAKAGAALLCSEDVAPNGATPAFAGATPWEPIRTCILSRAEAPRDGLIRLALSPEGDVLPDVRAKAPGRGAWIGVDRAELDVSGKKLRGALARAFKGAELRIPDDLGERIAVQLERAFLDRLGLEAKAGHIVTGGERIEKAARGGKLLLLLHASDAAPDGTRKLDQAWRVGSDREGSALKGLTLPLSRTILSLSLGRENVVHVGLTDAKSATRVSDALIRWLHFIGPDCAPKPCESGSQGASALPADLNDQNEQEPK